MTGRILIVTPFNNEDHSFSHYIKSLLVIDYPKELIDLVWLENDSVDNTKKLLDKWHPIIKKKGYHSFRYISKSFGLKLDKLPPNARKGHAGKNVLTGRIGIARAKKLCRIYSYLFSFLTDEHDYVLMWMADAVSPPNTIKRFLEVFKQKPKAGCVGGVIHNRPSGGRGRMRRIGAPWLLEREPLKVPMENPNKLIRVRPPPRTPKSPNAYHFQNQILTSYFVRDEDILELQARGKIVFEAAFVAHVFMIKREIALNPEIKAEFGGGDIFVGMIEGMWRMGYRVYCASDVYIKHVCLNGTIRLHKLVRNQLPT